MDKQQHTLLRQKRRYCDKTLLKSPKIKRIDFKICKVRKGNVKEFTRNSEFRLPMSRKCKKEPILNNTNDYLNDMNPFDLSCAKKIDISGWLSSSLSSSNFTLMKSTPVNSSADSGFETESIFSFASKSTDCEETSSSVIFSTDLNASFSDKSIDNPVIVQSIGQGQYQLPTVNEYTKLDEIPQITSETLAKLLTGKHKNLRSGIRLFDCRFPYEYEGGHITGASNTYTCQKLLQNLFPKASETGTLEQEIDNMKTSNLKRDKTINVFYCEFSSHRAPKLADCLRGLDRLGNSSSRHLCFPNIYLLHNGYCEFYNNYPDLCIPEGYVNMQQTPYALRSSNVHNQQLLSVGESSDVEDEASLNNINSPDTEKLYRKEQLKFQFEMKRADKTLQEIISKRTNKTDILKLFYSNLSIGASP